MSQQTSTVDLCGEGSAAASRQNYLPAGGDLAERPAESSKAPAQSACETNEGRSGDREGSVGLAPTAAAVELHRMKTAMTSWKRYHRPRTSRSPMHVVRVMRGQQRPVRGACGPIPGEPFPPRTRHILVLVRQTAAASGLGGGAPRHQTRRSRSTVPCGTTWTCDNDNKMSLLSGMSGEDQTVWRAVVLDQTQEDVHCSLVSGRP